ncbi:MAG: HAD hydrolase-like protein [Thaumarchaeota archaeon]|nr:HAD hydrolase-like protein [Nitrososphaerota archaeon]
MSAQKKSRGGSIVFDLFHTLVDPDELAPRDFQRTKKIAELFRLDAGSFDKYWNDLSSARNTSKSKKSINLIEDFVVKNTGRPPTKGDLLVADTILGRYHDRSLQDPKSDVVSALHNLKFKGLRLGVLCNTDERQVAMWFRSPLSGLFDAACFSFEIGYQTPAREAYSTVLEKLGVPANASIYVGDDGAVLKGAKDAGFAQVVFMEGFVSRDGTKTNDEIRNIETVADKTVQRISELEEMV